MKLFSGTTSTSISVRESWIGGRPSTVDLIFLNIMLHFLFVYYLVPCSQYDLKKKEWPSVIFKNILRMHLNEISQFCPFWQEQILFIESHPVWVWLVFLSSSKVSC